MDSLMTNIGRALKNHRQWKSYSRNDVAKRVGREEEIIARLEEGRSDNLEMITLQKICDVLDLPMARLIAEAEQMDNEQPGEPPTSRLIQPDLE
jgi:transcriptional regulator with XRE-family HTH domain